MTELELLKNLLDLAFLVSLLLPVIAFFVCVKLDRILAELRKLHPSPASPTKEKEAGL